MDINFVVQKLNALFVSVNRIIPKALMTVLNRLNVGTLGLVLSACGGTEKYNFTIH